MERGSPKNVPVLEVAVRGSLASTVRLDSRGNPTEIYLLYLQHAARWPWCRRGWEFNRNGKPHLIVSGVLVSLRTLIINRD